MQLVEINGFICYLSTIMKTENNIITFHKINWHDFLTNLKLSGSTYTTTELLQFYSETESKLLPPNHRWQLLLPVNSEINIWAAMYSPFKLPSKK